MFTDVRWVGFLPPLTVNVTKLLRYHLRPYWMEYFQIILTEFTLIVAKLR
jgi:hypothetical protein